MSDEQVYLRNKFSKANIKIAGTPIVSEKTEGSRL